MNRRGFLARLAGAVAACVPVTKPEPKPSNWVGYDGAYADFLMDPRLKALRVEHQNERWSAIPWEAPAKLPDFERVPYMEPAVLVRHNREAVMTHEEIQDWLKRAKAQRESRRRMGPFT